MNYLSQFLLTWLLLPVVKHSAPGRNLASTLLKGQCNWNKILITRKITPLIKGTVWRRILVPRRIKAVKGQCGTGYSPPGKTLLRDVVAQKNYTLKILSSQKRGGSGGVPFDTS